MFEDVINKVKKFNRSLNANRLMSEVLKDGGVLELIVDLNTGQLFEGEDSEGDSLGIYSPVTIQLKQQEGRYIDERVRLRDTGEFYNSFEVKVGRRYFEINADTIKDGDDLTDRYGDEILGLQDVSKEKLVEFIIPIIIDKITQQI